MGAIGRGLARSVRRSGGCIGGDAAFVSSSVSAPQVTMLMQRYKSRLSSCPRRHPLCCQLSARRRPVPLLDVCSPIPPRRKGGGGIAPPATPQGVVEAVGTTLGSAAFEPLASGRAEAVVLLLYAPWCAHSLNFFPVWSALAEGLAAGALDKRGFGGRLTDGTLSTLRCLIIGPERLSFGSP